MHCLARCIRRSWLCGWDSYSQKSFEHRKPWVERKIAEQPEVFACSILSYVVMSNHFHLVVPMLPAEANAWSAQQVAERWCRLFPKKKPEEHQAKIEAIAANTANVAIYRERLHDLSWLMKMISEPIARRARRLVAKAGAFGPHYLKLFSRLIAACLDTAQKRPDANHTALNIRSRQTLKQTLSPLR